MANTTSTTLTEMVPIIRAESMYALTHIAGILDTLVIKNTLGGPGLIVEFPEWDAYTSSNVTASAEGTDDTTSITGQTNTNQATIGEHTIYTVITDLAQMTTQEDVVAKYSNILSYAMKAKLEDDVVSLFPSFSQTGCTAGTTMAEAHWWDSIRQIRVAGAPMNQIYAVLSPKSYYGAKGMRAMLDPDTGTPSGALGEELKTKGYVEHPFGIAGVLVSAEIDEDVATLGDAANAIYAKGAIGLHTKGLFNVEIERNASLRAFEMVCVGRWGEVEIFDTFGVYNLADVA